MQQWELKTSYTYTPMYPERSTLCLKKVPTLKLSATSGGSRGRPEGHTPRWRPEIFCRQYINIITKPTAYDGPWEY